MLWRLAAVAAVRDFMSTTNLSAPASASLANLVGRESAFANWLWGMRESTSEYLRLDGLA